jgi:hypothetical protein
MGIPDLPSKFLFTFSPIPQFITTSMQTYAVLFLMFLGTPAFSQVSENHTALVQATTVGLADGSEVRLSEDAKSLIVGQYVIPVSADTHVKAAKRKSSRVEFSLQRGTAITSTTDSSWRRASFSLEFKSKEAAKKFVDAFRKAVQ